MKLTPTMASRKLQVLDFIRTFYARHQVGPSHSEIAAALKTNRTRVQAAVRTLAREGRILHDKGVPRGIRPIESREEAIRLLEMEGYIVNPLRLHLVGPVLDIIVADRRGVTKPSLPLPPELDHIPDIKFGGSGHERDPGG